MNTIIILSMLLKVAVSIPPPDDQLHIYALPVGQGDCTVIQCPKAEGGPTKGVVTIIDAGASNSRGIGGQGIVDFLTGTKLNFVIITHSHKDHQSYIDTILDYYKTPVTVYHPCDWSSYRVKSTYAEPQEVPKCTGIQNCAEKIKLENLCPSTEGITMSFVASAYKDCAGGTANNEDSIISKITWAGTSALITGDFELTDTDMDGFLMKAGPDLKSQIYRLSHHGALHANPPNLLTYIQAQYVFSSSGYRYGHPRCEIYLYYDDEKNPYHLVNSVPPHPYTCYKHLGFSKYEHVDMMIKKPIFVTSLFREVAKDEWIRSYYLLKFSIDDNSKIGVYFTHIGDEKMNNHYHYYY